MRFKRTSLLMKLLILALVVYSTFAIVTLQNKVMEKRAEAEILQSQIDTEKQGNFRLEQAIDNLDTQEGIEAVARQKLGMVSRGEIVFYDVGQQG